MVEGRERREEEGIELGGGERGERRRERERERETEATVLKFNSRRRGSLNSGAESFALNDIRSRQTFPYEPLTFLSFLSFPLQFIWG